MKDKKQRPEEQLRKAKDSAFLCLKTNKDMFTDFYDPVSLSHIFMELNKINGLCVVPFGGFEGAERAMLGISCGELKTEFPIDAVFIDSSKFSKSLTHRDFLGAVIALGISRAKLGDIFVNDGNAVLFAHKNVSGFIVEFLGKVGNISVKVGICENTVIKKQEGKHVKATVASLRADSVIGEAFGLSRGKAKEIIESEKLFVNWMLVTSAAHQLKEGDVLSVRGKGRAIIRLVGGKTKKDRIFLEMERWI